LVWSWTYWLGSWGVAPVARRLHKPRAWSIGIGDRQEGGAKLSGDFAVTVPESFAQFVLLEFAGRGAGELGHEADARWTLEVGHSLAAESDQLFFGRGFGFAREDQGDGRLAPFLVGDSYDRAFEHCGMLVEAVFDLRARNILATGNDHVFLAVDYVNVFELIPDGEVARMEIAVVDGFRGLLGLLVVADCLRRRGLLDRRRFPQRPHESAAPNHPFRYSHPDAKW